MGRGARRGPGQSCDSLQGAQCTGTVTNSEMQNTHYEVASRAPPNKLTLLALAIQKSAHTHTHAHTLAYTHQRRVHHSQEIKLTAPIINGESQTQ